MKKYNAVIIGYGWVAGRKSRPSTPLHWRRSRLFTLHAGWTRRTERQTLNAAYQRLLEPKERLRHLLELDAEPSLRKCGTFRPA